MLIGIILFGILVLIGILYTTKNSSVDTSDTYNKNTISCQFNQLDGKDLTELIEKFDIVYIYCNGKYISDYSNLIEHSVKKLGASKVLDTIVLKSVRDGDTCWETRKLRDDAYNIEASLDYGRYKGNKL